MCVCMYVCNSAPNTLTTTSCIGVPVDFSALSLLKCQQVHFKHLTKVLQVAHCFFLYEIEILSE